MKKPLANSFTARISMAGAIASAMFFSTVVTAQDSRLSLADRVTQLEQQAQNKDQGGIGMVNQMQQLQAQVQQLQGQIEELQHSQQQLDDKNKAQYGDIDARLGRLEAGNAGTAASKAPAGNAPANAPPATPPNNPSAAAPAAQANAAPNAGPNTAAADPGAAAAYDVAFKAIRAGDYVSASRDFRGFIQKYPSDALTPNAFYWLGESYYATMNYQVALDAFQHLLTQFPQSEKAPDALLKLGYSQLELKQMPQAKATLTSVASKYPGSKAAGLAQERLRQIQQSSAN
ncbi:tol-pal system protein YbgF [Rhodanobacter sp. MP1X3]|uniref:tol-pal system protein YbgF n=1 Tax=Rhodanobacter sp. MP1X3 TaxID=2723086 RepID=UPI001837EC4E|nr:tol-pal system protein YbgF [Rhodanobacter sp. MP1X3]MBB6241539.1 tol-pal system protein YbgF [Rhodanobacter sp. MP1X3]